ncbi:MAG: type II toxin-antitoxin system VapC family toxin [Dehalococcoidia bacterium]
MAIADTHAVVWSVFDAPRLSDEVRHLFEESARLGDQIALSAITLVEVIYLAEKGRIPSNALERLLAEIDRRDTVLTVLPLERSVVLALAEVPRSIVPDMPDRIIAATAKYLRVPLITRDAQIRRSGVHTIW